MLSFVDRIVWVILNYTYWSFIAIYAFILTILMFSCVIFYWSDCMSHSEQYLLIYHYYLCFHFPSFWPSSSYLLLIRIVWGILNYTYWSLHTIYAFISLHSDHLLVIFCWSVLYGSFWTIPIDLSTLSMLVFPFILTIF